MHLIWCVSFQLLFKLFSYTYILIYRFIVFCIFLTIIQIVSIVHIIAQLVYYATVSEILLLKQINLLSFNYCKIFHLIIMPHLSILLWMDIYLAFISSLLWQCCNDILLQVSCTWAWGRISMEYSWWWKFGIVGHLHFPLYCYVWIVLPLGLQVNLYTWKASFPAASFDLMFLLIRWMWNGISFLF